MRVHLVNPSDLSFGTAVITPRWLFVLAAATPKIFGDPLIIDETLEHAGPGVDCAGRCGGHRHPHRQCAARLRAGQDGARARRVGRLWRHPLHAVPRRGPRPRPGPRRGPRRRRPRVADRAGRLRRGHAARAVRGRTCRRRCLRARTVGPAAAREIHVGLGADRARLPEALLVLLGLEDRRAEASPAWRRRRRARDRGVTAAGLPVHPPGRRQLLPRVLGRPADGQAARGQSAAHRADGSARRAVRVDAEAGPTAEGHGVLHADHHGGRRGHRVSRRDARGAYPRRAGGHRIGDAGRPQVGLQGLQSVRATSWSRACRSSRSTASTSWDRSSSAFRATSPRPSWRRRNWRSVRACRWRSS